MSVWQMVTLAFEAVLGLLTAWAAYSLFSKTPASVQKGRDALHYPRWYWVLAGVMATIGSIGLLVGLFFPTIGALAALWMVAYFIVAMLTHLIRADFVSVGFPFVFLLLYAALAWLHLGDGQPVLALIGM
jgi:DoxX-like protein